MKQSRKLICFLFTLTLLVASLAGCQKKEAECPFTTIKWGNTLEDITKLEGDSYETYDSSYDGTTYTYAKEYNGLDGIIKYMFDDKEKLVGIAWTYISDDADDVKAVYGKIHDEAENSLGKSGYNLGSRKEELNSNLQENQEALNNMGMSTPLTDVWYLKGGNVTMNAVITDDVKAVQYSFLHPDVSQADPDADPVTPFIILASSFVGIAVIALLLFKKKQME